MEKSSGLGLPLWRINIRCRLVPRTLDVRLIEVIPNLDVDLYVENRR